MGGFVLFVILERGQSGYRCQAGVRGNDGDGGHAAQWTCQRIPPSRETWHTGSHISTTGHRFDSLPLANNNEYSLIITMHNQALFGNIVFSIT